MPTTTGTDPSASRMEMRTGISDYPYLMSLWSIMMQSLRANEEFLEGRNLRNLTLTAPILP